MDRENQEDCYNIGRLISNYLAEANISIESAAAEVGMSYDEFTKILRKSSTDSETLSKISVRLKHNFMEDYAKLIEKELSELRRIS